MPEMALTVITPSIRILQTLMSRRSLHLVGLGGDFSPTEESFFGETASRTLREYAIDTLFSPARGWSAIAACMRVRKPTPPC
jgi:DeoR family L-fucose operon activator